MDSVAHNAGAGIYVVSRQLGRSLSASRELPEAAVHSLARHRGSVLAAARFLAGPELDLLELAIGGRISPLSESSHA